MAEIGQRQEQLQPGIDKEGDPRDVARLKTCLVEAVGNGALGEILGLLVPGESLLFSRGDDCSVADESRCGIVGAEVEAKDDT